MTVNFLQLFPGIMTSDPDELHKYSNSIWPVLSGLRFLRTDTPEAAEYDYAFFLEQDRLFQELIHREGFTALLPFNVVRRMVSGKRRYITFFPEQGGGRSWSGEIPEEYKTLATLEPLLSEPETFHLVTDVVRQKANDLPDLERGFVYDALDNISDDREPYWLPDQVGAISGESPADARLRLQAAKQLTEMIDVLFFHQGDTRHFLDRLATYAQNIATAYNTFRLSGIIYSQCLIICEIFRTAFPAHSFERTPPLFTCGRPCCDHRICNAHKGQLESFNTPEVGRHLAENQANITRVLQHILRHGGADGWVLATANRLFEDALEWKSRMNTVRSAFEFYDCHFWCSALFRAAQYGYDAPVMFTKKDFQRESNWAEEYKARSTAGAIV